MKPCVIIEQEELEIERGGLDSQQLFNLVKDKKNPVLCIIKAGEVEPVQAWIDIFRERISEVRQMKPDIKVHFTVSHFQRFHEQELRAIVDSVLFTVADFVRPYYRLFRNSECQVSTRWRHDAEKFLFLTGKPNKDHRIGLLYQLDRKGLLDRCTWSLHVHDINIEQSIKILQRLNCPDPTQWIACHLQNPDKVRIIVQPASNAFHYTGIPFDTNLYEDAKFQLISESQYSNATPPWASEKTGLALANKNPFIVASAPGTLKALNDLGFVTFDKFCLHKDYDLEIDDKIRMTQIVENVEYWLKNITDHQHEINHAVNLNFERFIELGQTELLEAAAICRELDIGCDPSEILPIFDALTHADWRNWYQRVRDPSWPDCDREEDFDKLPARIRQECIEVFGYRPKGHQ